jgi:hypothetical protein
MKWLGLAAAAVVAAHTVFFNSASVSAAPVVDLQVRIDGLPMTDAREVEQQGCKLEGPAHDYAPRINDFGRSAYTSNDDDGYWDGRGYMFGFRRDDREAMMSHPWGAYLVGGIVLAENEGLAAQEFKQAVEDWPRDWYESGPVEEISDIPTIGAETVVLRRLSTWEIDNEQPMTEVFLAFRYCNLNAHLMLATMPDQDAVGQAVRYASIIQAHIRN